MRFNPGAHWQTAYIERRSLTTPCQPANVRCNATSSGVNVRLNMCTCSSDKLYYVVNPEGIQLTTWYSYEMLTQAGTEYRGHTTGGGKIAEDHDSDLKLVTVIKDYTGATRKVFKNGPMVLTVGEMLEYAGVSLDERASVEALGPTTPAGTLPPFNRLLCQTINTL